MTKLYLVLLIQILLINCRGVNKKAENDFPVLIEPKLEDEIIANHINYDEEVIEIFQIYYLGEAQDTILLDYNLNRFFSPPPPPPVPLPPEYNQKELDIYKNDSIRATKLFSEWKELQRQSPFKNNASLDFNKYNKAQQESVSIKIDTSRFLYSSIADEFGYYFNSKKRYPSYPVFIENKSSEPILIGTEFLMSLRHEISEDHDEWSGMRQYLFPCGNGLRAIYLLPHQIVITSVIKFENVNRSRLRLGEAVSEAF